MWKGHTKRERCLDMPGCDSRPCPDIRLVTKEAMLRMSDPAEMVWGKNEELSQQPEQNPEHMSVPRETVLDSLTFQTTPAEASVIVEKG